MKTVVCGLGKCGSRMVMDLNALIFGGKYSFQLRFPKDGLLAESFLAKFRSLFRSDKQALAKNIHDEEVPPMHMGDSDNQNEVLNMCLVDSEDERDNSMRRKMRDNIIQFDNYHDACGQYHIIGEEVMRNLFAHSDVKKHLVDKYISLNNKDNVSSYFIMFSAGGGTGCGTSTILASKIADRANEQFHNMLVAGITALPGLRESENYKISAGRFLTKFLSSPRSTSFDTVITVSNTIMEGINKDSTLVQTEANIFAAHLIFSIINSSSKFNRSSVNPDGPELRKNIHGLAYFCYAQQVAQDSLDRNMVALDLLQKALSPVNTETFDQATGLSPHQSNTEPASFEGTSISFVDGEDYTITNWNELVDKIGEYRDFVQSASDFANDNDFRDLGDSSTIKGNIAALENKLNELFDDPRNQLPLPMRSCKNVVVLRSIPDGSQSSHWEQTCLTKLVETLFPKARVHYYATYAKNLKEDTLTLIPSEYISGEVVDMIIAYLTSVWEKDADADKVVELLLSSSVPIESDDIVANFGDREIFERHFPDFIKMRQNTSGRFELMEEDWDEKYINASQVADMMNNVHEIVKNVNREKKTRKIRRSLGI